MPAGTTDDFLKYSVCVEACPTSSSSTINYVPTSRTISVGTPYATNEIAGYCVPTGDSGAQYFSDSNFGQFISNMTEAKYPILISMLIVLVLTLIYIKFMDWCAFYLSWVIIVVAELSLIGIGLLAYFEA